MGGVHASLHHVAIAIVVVGIVVRIVVIVVVRVVAPEAESKAAPEVAVVPEAAIVVECESAQGPDADRHVKLLSQFAVEGSLSGAYSHTLRRNTIN
jgi:hypothetical protein